MASARKAVVPAAGRGTRFLPATKAVPKELIPVIDRPSIQYVVEEARAAGLTEIALITAEGKEAVEAHFSPDPALQGFLEAKGETVLVDEMRRATALGPLTYIVQAEPDGLARAVGVAEDFVGREPFCVLLGDDFCDPRDPMLPAMIALNETTGMSVILLLEVPLHLVRLYSSVQGVPLVTAEIPGMPDARIPADAEVMRLSLLNEKPRPGEELSNFAIIGRYVFTPAIFDAIRAIPPGRNGEYQLTDAINLLAPMPPEEGGGVLGLVCRGRRYDTGDKLEYLKAVVSIAADRPDLGPAFTDWLSAFVSGREER